MQIDAVLTANQNLQIKANKTENLRWQLQQAHEVITELRRQLADLHTKKLKIAEIRRKSKDVYHVLAIENLFETDAGIVIDVI